MRKQSVFVGQRFKTASSGIAEVINYETSQKVTIRFLETGNEYTLKAANLKTGAVRDKNKNCSFKTGDIIYGNKYGDFQIINMELLENILIRFVDTGHETTVRRCQIDSKSIIDCMRPSRYGVGFIGSGSFKTIINGKSTRAYVAWANMFKRCYSKSKSARNESYKGVVVSSPWHNFQNFASWYNLHGGEWSDFHLDKDIIVSGNRIYDPYLCVLVPGEINTAYSNQKQYAVISPDGKKINGVNGEKFCRENNLNASSFNRLVRGKVASYKGWTKQ